MKRELLFQIALVFFAAFAGMANPSESKAQNCAGLIGYPAYDQMMLNTLTLCGGDVNKVLNGAGSPVALSSVLGYTPYNGATNPNGFLTSEVDGSVTNEIELPSQVGNAGRSLVTNGTSVLWGKRRETYSGTTNASGNYVVTFGTAYAAAPNIQANIIGGTNTNLIKITAVSTTGFTVNVVTRVDVVGLLPSYNNVNGAAVDVLITEK